MNPMAIKAGISVAQSLWAKFNDVREEKAREAYAALENAASSAAGATEDFFPESRKQAGKVTQAAHKRLERALADLNSRREDATEAAATKLADVRDAGEKKAAAVAKDAKKTRKAAAKDAAKRTKRTRKEAKKLSAKIAKKAGRKKSGSKFWPVALIVALVSAVAGGVYYVLRRNDKPGHVPPRVEEFSGGADAAAAGSTLVYTSTTEKAEQKVPAGSDLAEEGVVERDEELLGSIDAQLAQHRAEAEAAEAAADEAVDTAKATETIGDVADIDAAAVEEAVQADQDATRVTDDRDDEGKHRLIDDK